MIKNSQRAAQNGAQATKEVEKPKAEVTKSETDSNIVSKLLVNRGLTRSILVLTIVFCVKIIDKIFIIKSRNGFHAQV